MTAPGGVIATVYVDVLPTVRDFSRNLRRQLRTASRELRGIDRELEPASQAIQNIGKVATGIVPGVRLARTSLLALGGHTVIGGLLSAAGAAHTLSGAVGVMPAIGFAAASGAGALAVGLFGVSDAMEKFAKGSEAFGEKVKLLSAGAQQTLNVFEQMRGEITAFRDAVQDRLFAGMDVVLRDLLETFLPRLGDHFGNLADIINGGAKELAAFVQSGETLADIDVITQNTETAFGQLRLALIPAATALRDLVTVGSSFLPMLATEVTNLIVRFSTWIQTMRATGELQTRIQAGIDVLRQLGRIAGNVGQILDSLFDAASESGLGLLDTVESLTGRLREFLESTRGQAELQEFLTSAREGAEALTPVIVSLADIFFTDLFPVLESFAKAVGPAVAEFFTALGDAIDQAAPGIESFAHGFAAFIRGLIPALPAVAQLVSSIGTLVGVLAGRLGPIIADIVTSIANVLTPIFSALAAVFSVLNDDALRLVVVIGAVVVILSTLVTAMRNVVVVAGIFAGATKLMSDGMLKTEKGVKGVVGFLSGPWGIALGLATTALGLFLSSSDNAAQEQTELKNAAADLNDVIREQNGVINANVKARAAEQLEEQGALNLARELGISLDDVTSAYLEQGSALQTVRDQLTGNIAALEAEQQKYKSTRGGRARAQEIQAEIDKNRDLLNIINQLVGGRQADADAQQRQAEAAFGAVNPYTAWNAVLTNTIDLLNQMTAANQRFQQQQLESLNSELAYFNQLERTRQELADGTKTLDIHTQEGRDNLGVLTQLAAAGMERIKDLQNQKASTEEINLVTQQMQDELLGMVQPFFASRQAALDYLNSLGLIPRSISTDVMVTIRTNINSIIQQVNSFGNMIAAGLTGRARGGPVRKGEWTVVGEEGPELVRWGRSARVFSTDESERMATDVGTLDRMTSAGRPPSGGYTTQGVGTDRPMKLENHVELRPVVRVYLGDRELTDVVRVEVDRRDREMQRRIVTNAGVRR